MHGFESGCGVLSFFHLLLSYFHLLSNYETLVLGELSHEMGTVVSSELLDAGSYSPS